MKLEELMLNDWVLYNENPYKVARISERLFLEKDGKVFYAPIEKISPLPLTAEILEKNGWNDWFEHSTIARSVSVLVEDNTNLCIQEIKGQDSMFVQISHYGAGSFKFRKHLKYVHELQHALKLCGIDKAINL